MPNERYIKLPMRERWDKIPLDRNGDPAFTRLFWDADVDDLDELSDEEQEMRVKTAVMSTFTREEVVHLVNKALYGMKYQRETHAARRAKITKKPAGN